MTKERIDKWLLWQMIVCTAILISTPFTHIDLPMWMNMIGSLLFVFGLFVMIVAVFYLGSNLTPFVRPKERGQLVVSGIYSIVRHPMYLGGILLTWGWSIYWNSWLAMIFSFILIFILDRKASEEEKWLTKKYPEYLSYKARVKKIIPFFY